MSKATKMLASLGDRIIIAQREVEEARVIYDKLCEYNLGAPARVLVGELEVDMPVVYVCQGAANRLRACLAALGELEKIYDELKEFAQ